MFANLRKTYYEDNITRFEEIMKTNHEQTQAKKRIKLMQGLGFFPATLFYSKRICFLFQHPNNFDLTVHSCQNPEGLGLT